MSITTKEEGHADMLQVPFGPATVNRSAPVYVLQLVKPQSPPLALLVLWKAFGFGLGCAVTSFWYQRDIWVPKLQILLGP
jgi:hypothetical protein